MKRVSALLLSLLFVVSLCACGGAGGEKWPTTGLGAKLPAPTSGTVKNVYDHGDTFSASVEKPADDEFEKYVAACKDKGFTVEAENDTRTYEAFNEEGYKLKVLSLSSYMNIGLEAPIELGAFRWPNSALGKAVPEPDADKAKVNYEREDGFLIYVGDMSADDFNDYVETCMEAGFNIDYDRGDKYFGADSKDGYHLRVEYRGFNIISVKAEVIEEEDDDTEKSTEKPTEKATEKPASKPTEKATEKATEKESGQVSASLKEVLDEYEAFIDKYIEFMKNYQNSTDVSSLMSDYNELMASYSEYMKKIDALDTDSMTAADYAYYVEVTTRVSQKLASING